MALLVLLFAIIGAMIGLAAASRNGFNPGIAALGGVLLGPFALLMLASKSTTRRQCPTCAEWVRVEASVCRYCQRELPPLPVERKSWMKDAPSPAAAAEPRPDPVYRADIDPKSVRCANPACLRRISPGERRCPHCGWEHEHG